MFDPPRVSRRLALMLSTLAISLVAVFAVAPQHAWAAEGDIASGDCGTCVWSIDANGKLTIAPEDGKSGEMARFIAPGTTPWFSYRDDIRVAVISSGVQADPYCSGMFYGCSNLVSVDLGGFDASEALYLSNMFYGCKSLEEVDISALSCPALKTMDSMFYQCSSLSRIDMAGLDFPSVTSARSMFSGCSSLVEADLTDLSVPKATNLSSLFSGCKKLETVHLDGLNCELASDVSYMFLNCGALTKLDFSKAKLNSVQNASGMFNYCSNLETIDLSGINSTISSCSWMFSQCGNLVSIFDDGGLVFQSDDSSVFSFSRNIRGGNGTSYLKSNETGAEYACIDKPGQPGYFTCKHSEVDKVNEVAASSSKEGSIAHYECSVCGKSFEDAASKKELKSEDLVLHAWGDWSPNGDATCTKDGTKTRTCSVCGKSEKAADEGSKLAHVPGEPKSENAKAATCTKDGSHDEVTYCKTCKSELSRETVADPKLGHDYTDKVVGPTCTEDGHTVHKCTRCGDTYEDAAVKATGHKPGDAKVENEKKPTCTEPGSYHEVRYCQTCGEKASDETKTTDALGHDETTKTSTKPAGLGSDGYVETSQVCKRCGEVLATSRTPIASAKSVSLAKTGLTYSGKSNRPSAKVTDAAGNVLRSGVDYAVSYADDGKDVGTHKVTVKGKGNYSFTKTLSFVVNPKGTSLSKVTGAKKALAAKWGKQSSQTTGYQLRWSAKSSMKGTKTATVKSTKTTSKKVTKLKKKTKYYVQVRTYKVVKGKTYYSAWSKAKSVKTK